MQNSANSESGAVQKCANRVESDVKKCNAEKVSKVFTSKSASIQPRQPDQPGQNCCMIRARKPLFGIVSVHVQKRITTQLWRNRSRRNTMVELTIP